MKVFISWSGDTSGKVAQLLKKWLKLVINDIDPWMSQHDIPGGADWFVEINKAISERSVGIAVITPENKESKWIHYECGGLIKGLSDSRVYYLCIGLRPSDVGNPLGKLNGTVPDREGMYKFVSDINDSLERPRPGDDLRYAFDVVWGIFEMDLDKIVTEMKAGGSATKERPVGQVLEEVLNTVRGMDKRLGSLEKNAGRTGDFTFEPFNDTSRVVIRDTDHINKQKYWGGGIGIPVESRTVLTLAPAVEGGEFTPLKFIKNQIEIVAQAECYIHERPMDLPTLVFMGILNEKRFALLRTLLAEHGWQIVKTMSYRTQAKTHEETPPEKT